MVEMPSLAGVRHDYLDVGGLRMHVAQAGREDAPAVLLVHGWPQNWWAWRRVVPELATDFRVIAPDLRGHGWTQAPAGGYEKQRLAHDVLALLDVLGLQRVTWVGHDWGGWAGFLAALGAPERVERLLSLCIPHPWTAPHPRQLALLSYQLPLSLPLLGARIARPLSRLILQTGRSGEALSEEDLRVFADRIPAHVSVAMYRSFLTRELPASLRSRPPVLAVPSTVLVGAQDLVTRRTDAGVVPGQPQLDVGVVDGVAHWLPEERPEAIVRWVRGGSDAAQATLRER